MEIILSNGKKITGWRILPYVPALLIWIVVVIMIIMSSLITLGIQFLCGHATIKKDENEKNSPKQ